MLVLTRKIDQGIVISGNIYVRVLGVERDRVKIGVSAPLDVTVLRQELIDRQREGATGKPSEKGKSGPENDPSPSVVTTGDDSPSKNA